MGHEKDERGPGARTTSGGKRTASSALARGGQRRARKFNRDLLIRRIRQRLPMGWDAGEHLATERAGAFASWCAGVEGLMDESMSDAIWDALEDCSMPPGWLPSGPDDPIIERAFAGVRLDAPAVEG